MNCIHYSLGESQYRGLEGGVCFRETLMHLI